MMYYDFTAGGKEYKLRLNTRNVVALEKKLGCNPLGIFGAGDRIPTVTEMVEVLHCSLAEFNHGITLEKAYGIFDDYIADGHASTDFINDILEIYKVSGIIAADTNEDEDGKN